MPIYSVYVYGFMEVSPLSMELGTLNNTYIEQNAHLIRNFYYLKP